MSYESTADRELKRAKECIRDAVKALAQITIEECDGHDGWKDEYRKKIENAFFDLVRIRKELG